MVRSLPVYRAVVRGIERAGYPIEASFNLSLPAGSGPQAGSRQVVHSTIVAAAWCGRRIVDSYAIVRMASEQARRCLAVGRILASALRDRYPGSSGL